MWVHDQTTPGYQGRYAFLITESGQNGYARAYIALQPPRTNQSHVDRAVGWCGSWNNVSTYGEGLVEITDQSKHNPDRVRVRKLRSQTDIAAALDALGYGSEVLTA